MVCVPGTDLVPCVERAGEQFRYATILGKVDDLESRSHFLIISLLGMALGCGRYAFSRAYSGDSQDFL